MICGSSKCPRDLCSMLASRASEYMEYTPRKKCRQNSLKYAPSVCPQLALAAPPTDHELELVSRLDAPDGERRSFQRLPMAVRRDLRAVAEVDTVEALLALSFSDFYQATQQSSLLQQWCTTLSMLRVQPFDESLFLQKMLAAPRCDGGVSVHEVLGVTSSHSARTGPPPRFCIAALEQAAATGADVPSILEGVADRRAGVSIAHGTGVTYDSHLNQIRRMCSLLGSRIVPADLTTVRRVSSVVNNPSTLRGWLGAWRQLHVQARVPWPGDGDPFLRAVRLGLTKTFGPPPERRGKRRCRLVQVLRGCVARHLYLEGAVCALACTYALRVPSELLRQESLSLFQDRGDRIAYGPIRRKAKLHECTLVRFCLCASATPLLCPHPWIALLRKRAPTGLCFRFTAATLMTKLRPLLLETGVPSTELHEWTSHAAK